MSIIAYSEITILDLLDNATYIYYADDAEGKNPSASPEGKKYIGIYSGPPFEGGQPAIPPSGTEWSKYAGDDGSGFHKIITKLRRYTQSKWNEYTAYGHQQEWKFYTDEDTPVSNQEINAHIKVGDTAYVAGIITDRDDIGCMLVGTVKKIKSTGITLETTNFIVGNKGDKGDTGEAGRGIDHTDIEYGTSKNGEDHSTVTKWDNTIPTLNQGDYLWVKTITYYTDGDTVESFSVSYSGIDGSDANTYYIETNQQEVLKFIKSDQTFSCSPEELSFSIYRTPRMESDEPLDIRISFDNFGATTSLDNCKFQYWSEGSFKPVPPSFLYQKKIGMGANEKIDQKTLYFNVQAFLNSEFANNIRHLENNHFRFWYCETKENGALEDKAIKAFGARFGTNKDLASFAVHAQGITSLIQDSTLDFSTQGLVIKNGGLEIYNKSNERVFHFNENNGNLTISGLTAVDGNFTGTINATNGYFSGEIHSGSGEIGGFKLFDNKLTSTDNENSPSLTLDGKSGEILAKKLHISGGFIEDQLIFGKENNPKSYLCNPDEHDGLILRASNIKILNSGIIELGNIRINSGTENNDGYIAHILRDDNNTISIGNWAIYADGHAYFKNIEADNVTLKNSVLEIGTVQSAGSTMIFKEAWQIKNIESMPDSEGSEKNLIKITLKNYLAGLEEEDWVMIDNFFYKITYCPSEGEFYFIVEDGNKRIKGDEIVVNFGKSTNGEYKEFTEKEFQINYPYYEKHEDEDGNVIYVRTTDLKPQNKKYYYFSFNKAEDAVISILGQKATPLNNYSTSNSLTMSDFYVDNENNFIWNKHLILGKLSDSGIKELEDCGYGLYSDNVYLRGSLTTKNINGTYAGINTNSNITYDEDGNDKIVFWAGAKSESGEEPNIRNSPFIVTESGNIYANKGEFNGSIITNSSIYGSDVYAMRLHGYKKYEEQGKTLINNALEIYGSGISFYSSPYSSDGNIKAFEIASDGFIKDDMAFITFTDSKAEFIGSLSTGKIEIKDNSISFLYKNQNLENKSHKILIEDQDLKINNFLKLTEDSLINEETTYLLGDLWLGSKLHYQKVTDGNLKEIGYDLYVEI